MQAMLRCIAATGKAHAFLGKAGVMVTVTLLVQVGRGGDPRGRLNVYNITFDSPKEFLETDSGEGESVKAR